ncbi:MAG: hypothetical protein HYW34_02940 [Candidatus Brennerbacteria bacterium]|nr:hypothetical protein [Candidatus Brennerbacteria bacterium]
MNKKDKKILKNKEILSEIYKNGSSPDPIELKGIYKITMQTGIIPNLSWLGHIKTFSHFISPYNFNVVGCNSFNGWFRWGYFEVQRHYLSVSPFFTVIDYDLKANWLSRRIKDTIVTIMPKQLYLGKFHYMIFGKPRFLGYFTMERQEIK